MAQKQSNFSEFCSEPSREKEKRLEIHFVEHSQIRRSLKDKKSLIKLFWLFVKVYFFAEFPSVLFRSELRNGLFRENLESHRMSTLFRGITKTVPSIIRGFFWNVKLLLRRSNDLTHVLIMSL